MLIAAVEIAVAAEVTADIDARSKRAPVVMPDVQLNFWADFYHANPVLHARGITFEAFLNHQVRNGALFEKLRHHRKHRRGASSMRLRGKVES